MYNIKLLLNQAVNLVYTIELSMLSDDNVTRFS